MEAGNAQGGVAVSILDPVTLEILIRAARVVAMATGILVAIDSVGILLRAKEEPPHRPRWSAASWLIAGVAITLAAGYLAANRVGFVDEADSTGAQIAVLAHWLGLSAAFTTRAISRAPRPAWVLLAAAGMAVSGIYFSFQGMP